ncbi:uncharacterized protein LOC144450803 [Glandiceps talaboti]
MNLFITSALTAILVLVICFALWYVDSFYANVIFKYHDIEVVQIWEEIQCAIVVMIFVSMAWASHLTLVVTNGLIIGYLYAAAIMSEGAAVFLSVCATNHELLESIRILVFGSDEYKDALDERRRIEAIRLTLRKDIDDEISSSKKKMDEKRRVQQQRQKQKKTVIVNAFTETIRMRPRNTVAPIIIEDID